MVRAGIEQWLKGLIRFADPTAVDERELTQERIEEMLNLDVVLFGGCNCRQDQLPPAPDPDATTIVQS